MYLLLENSFCQTQQLVVCTYTSIIICTYIIVNWDIVFNTRWCLFPARFAYSCCEINVPDFERNLINRERKIFVCGKHSHQQHSPTLSLNTRSFHIYVYIQTHTFASDTKRKSDYNHMKQRWTQGQRITRLLKFLPSPLNSSHRDHLWLMPSRRLQRQGKSLKAAAAAATSASSRQQQ